MSRFDYNVAIQQGGSGAVTSFNGQTGDVVVDTITSAERAKLAGIEAGAEVNNISDVNATDLTDGGDSSLHFHSSDRDRANHTGTQTMSTISDAGDLATLDQVNTNEIVNHAVTNTKLATMSANTVKGRLSGNGTPQDIPMANLPISTATQTALDGKVNKSGDTMMGKLTLIASTTSEASLTLPLGNLPTAPEDGDIWRASAGIRIRRAGATRTILDDSNTPVVSQSQAETESNTGTYTWTPQRVRQAIRSALSQQLTAKLRLLTSTTASAGLNIPEGVTPTTPVDGDIWQQGGLLRRRSSAGNLTIHDTLTAPDVTQAEAEAGTLTNRRMRSPERVRQAIRSALLGTITRANSILMSTGTVSPEGVVTAGPGSIYQQTDGNIRRKASGGGSVGWVVIGSGTTSREFRVTIPGEQVADTNNFQGLYLYNNTGATITISNVAVVVGTAAGGSGAGYSINVYKSSGTATDGLNTNAVALFSSDISLGTNFTAMTNTPNTATVENGRWVTVRVISSAGATNRASNAQIIITYT